MRARLIAAAVTSCGMAALAHAQCEVEPEQVLIAGNAADDHAFGAALALEDDLAVVGASYGKGTGYAWIYRYRPADGRWHPEAFLHAPDPLREAAYGSAVALSGDVVLVGAPRARRGAGLVYAFRFDGVEWIEDARLEAPDGGSDDGFGSSLALLGDVAVIGAPGDDAPFRSSGSVYLFRYDGQRWNQDGPKLTRADAAAGDQLGHAVAFDHGLLIASAPGAGGGSVSVFEHDGSAWREADRLVPAAGTEGARFGASLALSGNALIVGAPDHADPAPGTGGAWIYRFERQQWLEEAQLGPPDDVVTPSFGAAVAISGDAALIGAPKESEFWQAEGAAYVFLFDGVEWHGRGRVQAAEREDGDGFGSKVAMHASVGLIGMPSDSHESGLRTGSTHIARHLSDCDTSEELDLCELLDGDLHDRDRNGVIDECAEAVWVRTGDGRWEAKSSWQRGVVPAPYNTAVFDAGFNDPTTYRVRVGREKFADRVVVRSDREVWIELAGADLVVTGTYSPSLDTLVIGDSRRHARLAVRTIQGDDHGLYTGTVSIANFREGQAELRALRPATRLDTGDLFVGRRGEGAFTVELGARAFTTGHVSIGTTGGAHGQVLVSGRDTRWSVVEGRFVVGDAGRGSLTLTGSARLETETAEGDVTLARQTGSEARVMVQGPDATWIEKLRPLVVGLEGPASITLTDGASITFPDVVMHARGTLQGTGRVASDLTSVGTLRPGAGDSAGTFGTVTISGSYRQHGELVDGEPPAAGNLFVDLGVTPLGVQRDEVLVEGRLASLGGGLIVDITGSVPQPERPVSVLVAPNLAGRFDAGLLRGLPADRLGRIEYGPDLQLRGTAAKLRFEPLQNTIVFGNRLETDYQGEVVDAVAGQFDDVAGLDVALAIADRDDRTPGKVLVLLNDGRGQLAGRTETVVGNELSSIDAADLDRDGHLDAVVTNRDTDALYILLGSDAADGRFLPPASVEVGERPEDVVAADVGEDDQRDVDLLVALGGDDRVQVLHNGGDARFATGDLVRTERRPVAVVAVDLNADRRADLVVANREAGTLSVMMNAGNGRFVPLAALPVGAGPADVVTADFNGDGRADLATADGTDGTMSLLLGTGSGRFRPAVRLPIGSGARSLAAADFDGDADADLVVCTGRGLQVLRNDVANGQLVFAHTESLDEAEPPALVVAAPMGGSPPRDVVTVHNLREGRPFIGVRMSAATSLVTPCPWDCGRVDGVVDDHDLQALLEQWGRFGSPCDLGAGPLGVGQEDYLELLEHFGACP